MLSSLFWLLVANVGLGLLECRGFKVVTYADDVVILVGGKFLSTLGELMESALGILSSWATNSGLGLNSDKTDFRCLPSSSTWLLSLSAS